MTMKLKNAKYLLSMFSFAVLVIAVTVHNATVSTVLTLICLLASLAVLYPNLAELSNVSENNPRAKSLKAVTIFNVGFVIIIVLIALAFERLESRGLLTGIFGNLSESQLNTLSKLFMALILAVPMLFFGNVAPQIPFNRYTGLRLPWTVRDEETWIVAHRVLGYVSFPIAILVFVNVPTNMLLDTYVKFWWLGAVVLWIAIPGLISALFYYRKWHGKP